MPATPGDNLGTAAGWPTCWILRMVAVVSPAAVKVRRNRTGK